MAIAKKWDVLALGNTAIDDLLFVPNFPAADEKVQVLRSERHCGGLAATAIVAASRLGARCAYAGALGNDEFSHFVRCTFERESVDISHVAARDDASPSHSVIIVDEARGTRNIFHQALGFSGADENAPDAQVIRAAKVLFVDRWGIDGTLRAMHIARDAEIPIVGDVEHARFARFEEWLELVDHLIVPQDFALEFTGQSTPEAAAQKLRSQGRKAVVVTMGENGCCALASGNEKAQFFPAFPVSVVDTTGCGDVFHGAYAAALAEGKNLGERIRVASAAAALKATQAGGQQGIPTRAIVEEFLKRHS